MEFARISQNFAKFAEEQASEKHRAEKSLKITGKYSQSVEISILCDRMVGIGKHRPENGTAPHLEARTERTLAGLYLKVRVVDIDGDLDVLYYAPGERNAEWFREREDFQSFTVSDRDIAAFRIDQAGVYTFYARDRRGNDTAYTVRIADLREGPGVLDQ